MRPRSSLPIPSAFGNEDDFVDSLLHFTASHELWNLLCGGVHILDFLTQNPDPYATGLPCEWREWFQEHDLANILDLLFREDMSLFHSQCSIPQDYLRDESGHSIHWRGGPSPPSSLVEYIRLVRRHSLRRDFRESSSHASSTMSRDIAVGMKPKKLHEVRNFARFVDHLASQTSQQSQRDITLVDFGSGQNYLGRTLTSAPYNRNVVALESKESNIERAKTMDVIAKVAQREQVRRDKKFYRSRKRTNAQSLSSQGDDRSTSTITELEDPLNLSKTDLRPESELLTIYPSTEGSGSLQHVQHIIDDGDLSYVDARLSSSSSRNDPTSSAALGRPPKRDLMVISLHSCGNLVHHGLRSLFLNPSVVAVALVGCCYNLMTERFGPQTYKFPALRSHHARLKREACRCDPHGFPMSKRLATDQQSQAHGVSLNITARSMAVQAPHNWTEDVCRGFFTRHFYRALLQRIFLDRGLIRASVNNNDDDNNLSETDNADAKASKENQPIIIGSLRKAAYASFTTYVHGAIAKLSKDPNLQPRIEKHLSDLTDEEIANYEHIYREHKKNLSIIWSLMAFSAEVAEALIVVDRWLFLKEHGDVVQDCWVEPVFDYSQSPRNLVVVGVKRQQREKDLS